MNQQQLWLNGVHVRPSLVETPEFHQIDFQIGHHINESGKEYRVEDVVHHWWTDGKYTKRVYIREIS